MVLLNTPKTSISELTLNTWQKLIHCFNMPPFVGKE